MEPSVFERPRGFFRRVEVAARDVLAPNQDLAVCGDLQVDTGHGFADGTLFRSEGMIQADDRSRLGQTVALHDDESQLSPERFERVVERRGADDESPEFQAE